MARIRARWVGPLTTEDEINDAVDAWHSGGAETGEHLHEYLGWTWEQYSAWAERGVIPSD